MAATPDKSLATALRGCRGEERSPSNGARSSVAADSQPDLQREFELLRGSFPPHDHCVELSRSRSENPLWQS